jgi:hypothetical protein
VLNGIDHIGTIERKLIPQTRASKTTLSKLLNDDTTKDKQ